MSLRPGPWNRRVVPASVIDLGHISPLYCLAPLAQSGKSLDVGALTLRNNYAMNQSFAGMPDRWV